MKSLRVSALLITFAGSALAQTSSQPVPVAPLVTLVAPDDYPVEAIKLKQQGKVRFRLDVGSDGQVIGCSILATSRSKSLDETSCQIMTSRARFTPARDAAGKPTAGTYESAISWILSEDEAVPRLNAATGLWFDCVQGEAAKLAQAEVTAGEVSNQAFVPCAQLEQLASAEMKIAEVPADSIVTLKEQLRIHVRDYVADVRKLLPTSPNRD